LPTIKLFANLRNVAETKELKVSFPSGVLRSASRGTSLRGVLNNLESEIPAQDGVILEDGQIRSHFVITINGHNTMDLNVTVTDDDVIAIFPPIAGG
jgi:molybdopterin converting factor small subunit